MNRISTRSSIALVIVILITVSCACSQRFIGTDPAHSGTERSTFPEAVGYVNDFEGILKKQEEEELTLMIKAHEARTTDQISIVTLSSIKPYENIDVYSLALAEHWGIGQKGKNSGVLIALGKELRGIRIQNGLGIEQRLTDQETQAIIEDVIIPRFKDDDYYEGIRKGLEAIIEELQ